MQALPLRFMKVQHDSCRSVFDFLCVRTLVRAGVSTISGIYRTDIYL